MDYKEKYEQALMVAKETYDKQPMYREWLEKMFPELAESEDEKIRKELIKETQGSEVRLFETVTNDKFVTWLENIPYTIDHEKREGFHLGYRSGLKKQGGQKPIWHNEDEEPQRDSLILLIMQSGTPIVAKIIEPNHTFNHGERWAYIDDLLEKQDKQKPIEIISAEESLGIDSDTYNKIIDACIYEDDKIEQKSTQEIEPFEAEHGKYYYCIKDYFCGGRKQASKGDVIQALRGLPIMGLKDASEYFLPVNFIKCNSAWSEEDEHRIKDIVYFLETAKKHYACTEELDACIDWLKSLRPQNRWKPSDGQMELLSEVQNALLGKDCHNRFTDFIWELKKLKEE